MEEYNQGWDPEVKRYFRKIINSFVAFATWLLTVSTLGLFFRLGYVKDGWQWQNTVFYGLVLVSFVTLLVILFRFWRKKNQG